MAMIPQIPAPKATTPTTKVRIAEVILITNWLSEWMGFAAKFVAIAIINEYIAYPSPPETVAPNRQRKGVDCAGVSFSGWGIKFGSLIGVRGEGLGDREESGDKSQNKIIKMLPESHV